MQLIRPHFALQLIQISPFANIIPHQSFHTYGILYTRKCILNEDKLNNFITNTCDWGFEKSQLSCTQQQDTFFIITQ